MNTTPYINWYNILGVDPESSDEDIKRAYRKHMKRDHPDGLPQDQKEIGGELSKFWNEAYEVLKDPKKRHEFDQIRQLRIFMFKDETLKLPVNDIPLLGALVKLHKTNERQIGYITKRSAQDMRPRIGNDAVSDDVYTVCRPSSGEVFISRRLDDYRAPFYRKQRIKLNTDRLTYDADEYFNISQIHRYGNDVNEEHFSDFALPKYMDDYLFSLDIVAGIIAQDGVAIDMSLNEQFSKRRMGAIRHMVSQIETLSKESNFIGEPVQEIKLGNFEEVLRRDEGLVRLEWKNGLEENQYGTQRGRRR